MEQNSDQNAMVTFIQQQEQQINFQPNVNTIQTIVKYLEGSQATDNQKQQEIYKQTQEYVQNSEFFMYLATIMSHSNDFSINTRLYAAVTLQSLSNSYYEKINLDAQKYIKLQIYKTFNDSSKVLSSKIGNIVTVFIQHGGFANWPEILDFLLQNLMSQNTQTIVVTISCLSKIVEDLRLNLENYSNMENNNSGQKIDQIIPKLLEFCNTKYSSEIRSKTFYCLNMCVSVMPEKFEQNLPYYSHVLIQSLKDQESEVRLRSVQGIQAIMETPYSWHFDSKLEEVIQGLCQLTGDQNYEVAKNACNFWMEYVQEWDEGDILQAKLKMIGNYLNILVPALIKGMRFTEEDKMNQISSGQNYIKPKQQVLDDGEDFLIQHNDSTNNNQDDEDDQNKQKDFFDQGEDSLRRVCGIILMKFSKLYRDKIFQIAQPIIGQLFDSNTWEDQEMGILTLGSVAEGSVEVISQHLPTMFPLLMQKMLNSNEQQLLSTTLWALSKFTSYIIEIAPKEEEIVKLYLKSIVKGVMHPEVKVQEASCYSLTMLINQGSFILRPFLADILNLFKSAIQSYSSSSMGQLFETIQEFIIEMREDINSDEQAAKMLLDPLVQKFQSYDAQDLQILPVSECLAVVSDVLENYFSPYCPIVFQKCYQMLENYLNPQLKDKAQEYNRKEICLRSVDVMSSVIMVSKKEFGSLQQNTKFMEYVVLSLEDQSVEIKTFMVSMIAEIAKNCPQIIEPYLEKMIQNVAKFIEFYPIELDPERQFGALCNNSVWCLCEFCFTFIEQLKPFAFQIAQKLVEFLSNNQKDMEKELARNFSKALGKLGALDPIQIGAMLPKFIKPFCLALRTQKLDQRYVKGEAFHGLFLMIKNNPQGVMNDFQYVIDCFVNYDQAKDDLKLEFLNILKDFRSTMDDNAWENYITNPQYFQGGFRAKLRNLYNL